MRNTVVWLLAVILLSDCEEMENPIVPVDEEKGYVAFIGRFDYSDNNQPAFMHSGSTIRARFSGVSVTLRLIDENLLNYFNVIIDDSLVVLKANRPDNTYRLAENLKDTIHTLEVFRRTEPHGGNSTFMGFDFGSDSEILVPEVSSRIIEFIGDSYLCGYANESSASHNQFSYETENAYMSFGAITSRAMRAEYISICYSGIGLVTGNGDSTFTMFNYYDLLTGDGQEYDYSQYTPDLAVISLGSNDVQRGVDSLSFVDAYISFLERVRNNYPRIPVICVAGPASLKHDWQTMRKYVKATVDEFSKTNPDVHYFQFTPVLFDGFDDHPIAVEHQFLANELTPFIRQVMNW